jgi:hypothetical protein
MQMPRRTSLRVEGILQDEEASRVLWDDFELNRADAEAARLAKEVLPAGRWSEVMPSAGNIFDWSM